MSHSLTLPAWPQSALVFVTPGPEAAVQSSSCLFLWKPRASQRAARWVEEETKGVVPHPSCVRGHPVSTAVGAPLLSPLRCRRPRLQPAPPYPGPRWLRDGVPQESVWGEAPREPPSSVGLCLLVFTCTGMQGHSPWICVLLDQNREYIILSHCPGDYLTKGVIPVGFKTVSLAVGCFSSERENKSLSSTSLPQKALCKA